MNETPRRKAAAADSRAQSAGKEPRPKSRAAAKSAASKQAAGPPAVTAAATGERHWFVGDAHTLLYVHGIGNKPIAAILKCQWDSALFGFDLGERSRLAYWVNRDYYPQAEPGTCASGDLGELEDRPTGRGLSVRQQLDTVSIAGEVEAIADSDEARAVLEAIGTAVEQNALERHALHADAIACGTECRIRGIDVFAEAGQTDRAGALSVGARVLPLPEVLRRWITRKLTRALLRDVNDFLFVDARRERMRESVRERLRAGGGPFVVVAHSQGSMVAYDVLAREFPDIDVALFVTIGSPLGLQEAQDRLKGFTGQRKLRVPPQVRRWINVADPFDPVALDKALANDYAPNARGVAVEDFLQSNTDGLRNPHSGTGYLRTRPVQRTIREIVDRGLFQPVANFVMARDVVRRFENAGHRVRQPVLIELADPTVAAGRGLDATREQVVRSILEIAKETAGREAAARRDASRAAGSTAAVAATESQAPLPVQDDDTLRGLLRLEALRRYVAADLTREEAERLSARVPGAAAAVSRVWRNAQKKALAARSPLPLPIPMPVPIGEPGLQAVQALPAHLGYRALGADIVWAVLDSGVNAMHPHFGQHNTIECRYDCTARRGLPPRDEARLVPPTVDVGQDENGHGTHVAGIIAGAFDAVDADDAAGVRRRAFSGAAPLAKLHSYRVLDRDGNGEDAWIIKALDHIAETNERAGELVIQGVNLSLGGPFDQSSFGCGHSPLCRELRRLWQQGVLVVLAAGNEGFQVLQTLDGTVDANMDLSIGDPANLEEAIAVGSVHAARPHTYGVSYFSSRGPTADGRQKPDVVAPGERIMSCRHHYPKKAATHEQLYVEMSGTSMAAPLVSGVLAAFLSVRREFIGYPDRVKALLLEQCTDLQRERFLQGAGLPNLMRMLMAT